MIEVFISTGDEGAQAARSVASEITLERPADVHFGSAAPDIAFYRKSGADLIVTLLDGREVVLRDFFVLAPDGSYSRLLLGPAGEEEITGLVAPEMPVPVPAAAQSAKQAAEADAAEADMATAEGAAEVVSVDYAASPGVPTIAGIGLGKLALGAVAAGASWLLADGGGTGHHQGAATANAPRAGGTADDHETATADGLPDWLLPGEADSPSDAASALELLLTGAGQGAPLGDPGEAAADSPHGIVLLSSAGHETAILAGDTMLLDEAITIGDFLG